MKTTPKTTPKTNRDKAMVLAKVSDAKARLLDGDEVPEDLRLLAAQGITTIKASVPLETILYGPESDNVREPGNEQIGEMLQSILQSEGILVPVRLRPIKDKDGKLFVAIKGNRRLQAAEQGITVAPDATTRIFGADIRVPAVIVSGLSNAQFEDLRADHGDVKGISTPYEMWKQVDNLINGGFTESEIAMKVNPLFSQRFPAVQKHDNYKVAMQALGTPQFAAKIKDVWRSQTQPAIYAAALPNKAVDYRCQHALTLMVNPPEQPIIPVGKPEIRSLYSAMLIDDLAAQGLERVNKAKVPIEPVPLDGNGEGPRLRECWATMVQKVEKIKADQLAGKLPPIKRNMTGSETTTAKKKACSVVGIGAYGTVLRSTELADFIRADRLSAFYDACHLLPGFYESSKATLYEATGQTVLDDGSLTPVTV